MDALLNSLSEMELPLARATGPEWLDQLGEDELIDLHTRVRRARNKHVKVYRRQAAAQVEQAGGRGKAYPKNSRSRAKAEVFEDALARISQRLAAAARASAAALQAERLAGAQRPGNPMPPDSPAAPGGEGSHRAAAGSSPRPRRYSQAARLDSGRCSPAPGAPRQPLGQRFLHANVAARSRRMPLWAGMRSIRSVGGGMVAGCERRLAVPVYAASWLAVLLVGRAAGLSGQRKAVRSGRPLGWVSSIGSALCHRCSGRCPVWLGMRC